MLISAVQKPTLKSCFSTDAFVETALFPQTMIQGRFELIMTCLHNVGNITQTPKYEERVLKFTPCGK